MLNVTLAVYLQQITKSGNGCIWYFMTVICDTFLGLFVAYLIFKIIDELAIRFGIEVSSFIAGGHRLTERGVAVCYRR